MRIRRNILAPALITISTVGALVAGPVLAVTSAVAPAATGVAAVHVAPDFMMYHG